MSIAKLVTGIISIVICVIMFLQSCAITFADALAKQHSVSGAAGIFIALLILAIGIISIATKNKGTRGGCVAIVFISIIACYVGYKNSGEFKDLIIWSIWSGAMGVLSFVQLIIIDK